MFKKISKLIVIALFGLVVSGCANSDFSHDYLMKGKVVSADESGIYICVGLDDGAQVGQILEVYRYQVNDDMEEGAPFFLKQETGQIKIEALVDEHFAKVSVLEGDVKKHDMVILLQ